VGGGRFEEFGETADGGHQTGGVKEIPVIAGNVRWERPTTRSFWNALADPEREALAAAGVEQIFRAGSVLCRAGDEASQVMIIDSGWVKVSVRVGAREEIRAVRGQGDLVGERALTAQVRSATVTALDEVSAMVVPAERFAEFLRDHPRATEVLQLQIIERREEDRARLSLGEPAGAERRLAWLLLELARRRGGYQQVSAATFTLPMSQQERNDGDREAVRRALYEISRSAFEASGVEWANCYYEDRGDGTVIVVRPRSLPCAWSIR
jgi:CRP-like cAMP-binding protein